MLQCHNKNCYGLEPDALPGTLFLFRLHSRPEIVWLFLQVWFSYLEEAPGQTQNTLVGFYIPSGLGTPRNPPGGAGACCHGEGFLGFPAGPVA